MANTDFKVKNGLVVGNNIVTVNSSSGRMGINNNAPDAALTVTGSANVQGNSIITGALTVANTLDISSGKFIVASNGNVGISNTTPTHRLSVNGDINIPTGSVYRVNGNQAVNGPFFSVNRIAGQQQTISEGTTTKLVCNNVIYDTSSGWNTTTSRYTVSVPGYYNFRGSLRLDITGTAITDNAGFSSCVLYVYKNGGSALVITSGTVTRSFNTNMGACFNGTIFCNQNDYIEFYINCTIDPIGTATPTTYQYNFAPTGSIIEGSFVRSA